MRPPVDRLKNRLIHKAKVKSAYGKMLRQEAAKTHDEQRDRVRGEDDEEVESTEDPDPQALYSDPRNTPEASTSHQPYVHPSRRSDVDASETVAQRTAKRPGESRKTQKSVLRRAEIQNHTKSIAVEKPKRRPKLSQEELEDLRAQRRMQNELYNRKTYKGQPNMNAKMQVLLSKIEKSVQR